MSRVIIDIQNSRMKNAELLVRQLRDRVEGIPHTVPRYVHGARSDQTSSARLQDVALALVGAHKPIGGRVAFVHISPYSQTKVV